MFGFEENQVLIKKNNKEMFLLMKDILSIYLALFFPLPLYLSLYTHTHTHTYIYIYIYIYIWPSG